METVCAAAIWAKKTSPKAVPVTREFRKEERRMKYPYIEVAGKLSGLKPNYLWKNNNRHNCISVQYIGAYGILVTHGPASAHDRQSLVAEQNITLVWGALVSDPERL